MSVAPSETGAWRKTLLSAHSTLRDVIHSLNASALRIALVAAEDGTLIGTVTDGDIRRALLRGVDLNDQAAAIAQSNPIVVPPDMSRDQILRLMQVNAFDAIPVVDEKRRILGLHLLAELLEPPQLPNVMVLMAGGRGTRLGAHTENCPKPLLPVAGKPMLEHIIETARADGFRQFVVAVHYLGNMIEDYFGNGERWNVNIEYLREPIPLGTAGAIRLLRPRPNDPLVVSNGDVLTDIKYSELLAFHRRHAAMATMAVRVHEWQHPFGVVKTNGVDIVDIEEKPITRTHINAGIYALEPEALELMVDGEPCDMPTLFARLRQQQSRTIVYPMHEPWLDVGGVDELHQARAGFDTGKPAT